jgi:hypothetical protein
VVCLAWSGGSSTSSVEDNMWSFAGAFPELAFDLGSELRATGRADLARELEASSVKSVSYDSEADAGLVAVEAERQLNVVERNVIGQKLGQVIAFEGSRYASLQLDNFGRVIGVELLAPPKELRWKLMRLSSDNRWRGR